jgi:hypothetical protein
MKLYITALTLALLPFAFSNLSHGRLPSLYDSHFDQLFFEAITIPNDEIFMADLLHLCHEFQLIFALTAFMLAFHPDRAAVIKKNIKISDTTSAKANGPVTAIPIWNWQLSRLLPIVKCDLS